MQTSRDGKFSGRGKKKRKILGKEQGNRVRRVVERPRLLKSGVIRGRLREEMGPMMERESVVKCFFERGEGSKVVGCSLQGLQGGLMWKQDTRSAERFRWGGGRLTPNRSPEERPMTSLLAERQSHGVGWE